MERLEEYAEEESPVTKTGNLPRDPIPEDLTTNSSELLQTVKDLKTRGLHLVKPCHSTFVHGILKNITHNFTIY